MLHTVFCILFTLHQRPGALRGTAVPGVVMNSNQRGGNGKSWVLLPVANLNKYLSNLHKYSGNGTRLQSIFPGVKPEGMWSRLLLWIWNSGCVFFIFLKAAMRSRKSQKVKRSLFFFFSRLLTTAGLAKCSGCEPATRTKQVTTLLRLVFFSTTKLHKTVSSLHSLTEVHPVWVIRYEEPNLWNARNSCVYAIIVTDIVVKRCHQIRGMVLSM